jgi:hypothetical protein
MVRSTARFLVVVAIALSSAAAATAQGVRARVRDGTLHVHAPALAFIEGDILRHLRDGRAIRVEIVIRARASSGGVVIAEERRTFNLSFDLWEERIAVTRVGMPPRSISHLTSRDAEMWCVDNVPLPLAGLVARGRDTPFWIEAEYITEDQPPATKTERGLTLAGLIDSLSRVSPATPPRRVAEHGPFRLSELSR